MTDQNEPTSLAQSRELETDRRGYLTIVKGDGGQEAKIVPSSLGVWERQGWSVKKTAKNEQIEPSDLEGQTDDTDEER